MFIGCFSNEQVKKAENDLSKMNINDGVSSIREYSFHAIDKFGEISKGERSFGTVFKFNQFGNLTELTDYDNNGDLKRKRIYEYDKENKLLEEKLFENGSLYDKWVSEYDSNGQDIERIRYLGNGSISNSIISKYDEGGMKIERIHKDESGSITGREIFKYNEIGQNIERLWYNENGILDVKVLNEFDRNNNKINEKFYKSDEIISSETDYRFDDFGNMIQMNGKYFRENTEIERTYKFIYDDKKNWVVQISFLNRTPEYYTEREINYK